MVRNGNKKNRVSKGAKKSGPNLLTRKFQRCIEDFVCDRCGAQVKGTGYTDHCPKCLWSKHVDINPGDRENKCSGLMEPMGVEIKNKKYVINYKCQRCGAKHRVKASADDDQEKILEVMSHM